MAKDTCSVSTCRRAMRAKGMCRAHYMRVRTHGDPLAHLPIGAHFLPQACTAVGCDAAAVARGLCHKHYYRLRVYGDPDVRTHVDLTTEERFVAKVDVGHPLGCWEWTGHTGSHGYGRFKRSSVSTFAHRFSVEHFKGQEIPEGMHVDHLCMNKSCVNPDHLEVVTPRENARRNPRLRRRRHAEV